MPIADDSLCVQTDNAGEVSKSAGACCYVATVDNVNLLTGELTITFTGTPPAGLGAQVTVPGANVRYNCGLCYTGGLGTNRPAMAFNRADSILCIMPPGPEDTALQRLFIVGHEFANGVEDQKACGQMGRMIIQPGDTPAGLNGYGSPFLEETIVDGVTTCIPVNPFFDPYLGVEIGKGTLNGPGKHLMVYGDGENLVAVRPYLFPNGSSYNGTLEKTNFVSDGLFPYGLRQTVKSLASVILNYGTASFSVDVGLQEPRNIGTDSVNYSAAYSLSVGTGITYGSWPSTWYMPAFSQPFAVTDTGIYIRSGGGIYKFNATIDPAVPSVSYSISDPANSYVIANNNGDSYYFQYDTDTNWATERQIGPSATVVVSDSNTVVEYNVISSTHNLLYDGSSYINAVLSLSLRVDTDVFSWTDTRHSGEATDTTQTSSLSNTVDYVFNGVTLCRTGEVSSKSLTTNLSPDYDGSNICSSPTAGDPPVTPEVTATTIVSESVNLKQALFLYANVSDGIALFITCEWKDEIISYEYTGTWPLFTRTVVYKLKLFCNGSITELESYNYTLEYSTAYTFGPAGTGFGVFGCSMSGRYTFSEVVADRIITSDSDTIWTSGGSSCYAESGRTYNNYSTGSVTKNYICYKSAYLINDDLSAGMIGIPLVTLFFTGYSIRYCPIRLMVFIDNFFNEFAKSDDGSLMYFSVPKLSSLRDGLPPGDDTFHRVLINNGAVSTDAKTILETATGLVHSQAGLRFAPVV